MRALIAIVLATSTAHAEVCEPIPVWRDGAQVETICRTDAESRGLTAIDLGDGWTPMAFGVEVDGAVPGYREVYDGVEEPGKYDRITHNPAGSARGEVRA